MKRVVITGIGIYSCLGKNLEEVTASLRTGKSGIGFLQSRKDMGYRSGLSGILEMPNLKGVIDRRARVSMPEQALYAYVSTQEALKNARLDMDFLEKNETGILFGNDSSAQPVIDAMDLIRAKKDTTLLGSGSVFQSMNSTVTMNLATLFKLKGINMTISAACASGSHAIGLGAMFIRMGLQERVICGGAQEVNDMVYGSFDGIGAFSINESDPTKASRPFDKNRDGLVPSGGAATLVLESYESAVKRGAPILAEVLGYGFSSNGDHIIVPSAEGPGRSLAMALRESGIVAKDVDYINAHATSTPVGDDAEARAIYSVFGECNTPVSSTKSMTGHECWMAGASEVVYSMLMMQNSFIAPNINFETPDAESAKLNIISKPVEKKINIFASNSFGFGGTNSTLVLKKY